MPNKNQLMIKLREKILEVRAFIKEKLQPRNDVNRALLDEYLALFEKSDGRDIETFWEKFCKARYQCASGEGEGADYTEGTSVDFREKNVSLGDYLLEIEDLIIDIRKV